MEPPWEIGRLPSTKPDRVKIAPVAVVAADMAAAVVGVEEILAVAVVETEIVAETGIDATNRSPLTSSTFVIAHF